MRHENTRGTAFALHSYSLEAGGYSYVVQTALYPADASSYRALERRVRAKADALRRELGGQKQGLLW